MVMDLKNGRMVLNIKEIGLMIKQMVMESFIMLMVTFMKENGNLIRLMVMEYTRMQMEQNTMENGKMTSNMVEGLNLGQMEQYMKENIMKVKRTGKENCNLLMDLFMKETLNLMRFVALAFIHGVMAKSTRVNGLIIKCMVKAICGGLMVKNTSETL